MPQLPAAFTQPSYSDEARQDSLLHYTTGDGLLGILRDNQLWSTAYYCANDELELKAWKDVLTPIFRKKTYELIQNDDSRVRVFASRGVDIRDYANKFEQTIISFALNMLCVYMTCFCRPSSEEDFLNGLLSQWRGYGRDGGYALQFSRSKLQAEIDRLAQTSDTNYELRDAYYSPLNPLKEELRAHESAFEKAYVDHLDMLASHKVFDKTPIKSPIANLPGGPLESLLEFMIHTKSGHFREENECRLSSLRAISPDSNPCELFNRGGLLVPFVRTPKTFNVLGCVEWIIIGPAPRMIERYTSLQQFLHMRGMDVRVRPSKIPYSRH